MVDYSLFLKPYQPRKGVGYNVEYVERYPADEESAAHKYQQFFGSS
jgi:hypothetical protein